MIPDIQKRLESFYKKVASEYSEKLVALLLQFTTGGIKNILFFFLTFVSSPTK
jgi:hypothetical protein